MAKQEQSNDRERKRHAKETMQASSRRDSDAMIVQEGYARARRNDDSREAIAGQWSSKNDEATEVVHVE